MVVAGGWAELGLERKLVFGWQADKQLNAGRISGLAS
jgi:hypothetical protein